jgi:sigma-B regulation protein RsbU (phosphoserine phosphatase)
MALKILVVDDEEDLELLIRQKFRQRIRSGEWEFSFARDGQQALELLQADLGIEIIFSDINMPVMDGLTLLSRVAEQGRTLKTIMVSAYDDLSNIRTAMNRGAFDFLTKPIDFQDFEHTLNKTSAELKVIAESLATRDQLLQLRSELDVAHRIQRSILPSLTPDPGQERPFDIYAAMLPARTVTGDFYDFFPLTDGRWAFAIGDVSGKGIPAAIFMAISRTVLRSVAAAHPRSADCLRAVNDILLRQGNQGMFVTLFYGALDPNSGEIEYSIGGQTPPYILRNDGGREYLDHVGGTMIGLLDEPVIESGTAILQPGETILLTTDGVTDAENREGEAFGKNRMDTALNRRHGSAREIVDGLFQAVEEFCDGATRSDDVTALALQYR